MAQKHFATALQHGLSGQYSPPRGVDGSASAGPATKRFQIDTTAQEAEDVRQSIDSVADYFAKREIRKAKEAQDAEQRTLVGREHTRPGRV